jgi:hypothetical protein
MRSKFRFALLAPLIGAIFAVAAPAAQAAPEFGAETLVGANCTAAFEACGSEEITLAPGLEYSFPKEPTPTEAREQAYSQAAGHPPFGITDFEVKTSGTFPNKVPLGIVKHVRTDVGVGVSTSPEAMAKCTMKEFDASAKEEEAIPGTGFYPAPECVETGATNTVIGLNKVVVYAGPEGVAPGVSDLPLEGTVYNLEQPQGVASDFGVALKLPVELTKGALEKAFAEKGNPLGKPTEEFLEEQQYYSHTQILGNVEWAGNYHDYYEINVSTALPLIASRLALKGNVGDTGKGGYVTNPSSCVGPGPATTNTVTLESTEGKIGSKQYVTPVGTEGCDGAAPFQIVPFAPAFALTPETKQSDQPDGVTTELVVPHDPSPTAIDSSQLKTASITLPEGLTLNPSAAAGLGTQACTPAQARLTSREAGVACPEASKIGTVALDVPQLPAGSLQGNLYLGGPDSGPITGPPYTMYIDAESARYGVSVRIKGSATPNPITGQLTASFTENPQQPFSNLTLHFKGGALAPLANPLTCGTATTATSLVPFTGTPAQSPSSSFVVDANNAGAACASPLPFSLTQGTVNQSPNGGAATSYTLNVTRADGQQYLSQIKTTLPEGLVGLIPTVTQCAEAEANAGTCPVASKIGVVGVEAGAGPTPYTFTGNVYLTGPYNGAPFGLSIVVPAVAGPFNLGNVVTRGTLTVDPYTARVTATSTLPTIVKGVPLRLRHIAVNINKQGFLTNPTNCGALSTDSTLSGFTAPGLASGATQNLSTAFQVTACGALAFKPSFKAKTLAKTSKANGASLETTLNIGTGQTNFKSVVVQLPKQLPSRLTTLQKACPEAVFNANPFHCPSGSFVGGARANTPTLPGKLQGPAILVSHGGEAFPDLDLVMEANGVRAILVGNTKITKGITTTTFASTPDVPVSSITVNLPVGAHSAVTANGNLCANPLVMPTTLTGQNGFVVKQNTKITVSGCGVRITGHKTVGNTAYITVQTYSPGRISGSGSNLVTTYRKLSKAQKTATLKVPLSRAGKGRRRPLKVKLRVGFVPKAKGGARSASTTTVTFG